MSKKETVLQGKSGAGMLVFKAEGVEGMFYFLFVFSVQILW